MHILIANFHLLANQGGQNHSCYSDTAGCFFSVFPSNISIPSLFRCGEIRQESRWKDNGAK